MASSYCRVCSATYTTVAEMSASHCIQCEETRKGAMQFHKEQNPTASESDLLYAGREAMNRRRTHPRQGFIPASDFQSERKR